MTKWSRVRRRNERRKSESEERRKAEELQRTEPQIEDLNTQQEKRSENIQQTRENVEQENTQTFKQKPILSQIPRYVYLVAFFALLSGVFYPLITPNPAEQNLDNVLKGTAILFLGLTGAILVYKGTISDKNRAAVVSLGLVLIAVSLALIFTIAGMPE